MRTDYILINKNLETLFCAFVYSAFCFDHNNNYFLESFEHGSELLRKYQSRKQIKLITPEILQQNIFRLNEAICKNENLIYIRADYFFSLIKEFTYNYKYLFQNSDISESFKNYLLNYLYFFDKELKILNYLPKNQQVQKLDKTITWWGYGGKHKNKTNFN